MKNTKTTKKTAKKTVAKKSAPVASATKMVDLPTAIRNFFVKYFDFNGASTRAEYWWVGLFVCVIMGLLVAVLPAMFWTMRLSALSAVSMGIASLFGIAIVIPSIALMSRRVHDAGFSAWAFFAPWLIVMVLQWLPFISSLRIVSLCGFLISVWGLALALMPSKTTGNPYRN